MFISYIRLKNFIGIYDGMGLNEVEINFNKRNRFVIFVGENGSGKSTIMSNCHPLHDSKDARRNQILEGMEGEKEIHFVNEDNVKFIVNHRYTENGKVYSYIDKLVGDEREELNPAGKTRNFKALVEEHLEFTDDYFRVGRLGSNLSSFLDLNSSDRKKFMAKFMPNVVPYQEIYAKITKQVSSLVNNVAFVSDELKKLDTLENLNQIKNNTSVIVDKLNTERDEARDEISRLSESISKLEQEMSTSQSVKEINRQISDLDTTLTEISDYLKQVTERQPSLDNLDSDNIDGIINSYNDQINKITNDVNSYKREIESVKASVSGISSNLAAKQRDLKTNTRCNTVEDPSVLKDELEELEVEKRQYTSILNAYEHPSIVDIVSTPHDAIILKSALDNIYEMLTTPLSNIAENESELILQYIESSDTDVDIVLTGLLEKSDSEVTSITQQISDVNSKITSLEQNAETAKILEKRPNSCVDNTCGFISHAVKFKDASLQLDAELLKVDSLKAVLSAEVENNNTLKNLLSFCLSVKKGFSVFKRKAPQHDVFKFNSLHANSVNDMISLVLTSETNSFKQLFNIADVINFLSTTANLSEVSNKTESILNKLNAIKSSSQIIEILNNDIALLEESYSTENGKLVNISEQLDEASKKLDVLNRKKTFVNTVYENKIQFNELTESISVLRQSVVSIGELEAKNASLNESLSTAKRKVASLENDIKQRKTEYDNAAVRIQRHNEYVEKREELRSQLEFLQYIKKATDPVKGIPLKMIDVFLEDIRNETNRLLDIAYGGEFRINFFIDEKDFFIRVVKPNGANCPDITMASQGQQAMTTTTLAFAILSSALKGYNVTCLDEIDSTLDEKHRRIFLDVLRTQVEYLGVDQTMIISHNDEFFAEQGLGLVLLKGHTVPSDDPIFLEGKDIVADFTK